MASKLGVINKMRPRIINQGTLDIEAMAEQMSTDTTFNKREVSGILRLYADKINAALQAGRTIKIDGLVDIVPNMKVGGNVKLGMRADRGAVSDLQNPRLWSGSNIANYRNMKKSSAQLIADWNEAHPDDLVED